MFDLEPIYDEKIAPLMSQIIAICKEHKMPMLATFFYARGEEDDEAFCTTVLLGGTGFGERGVPRKMQAAADAITKGHAPHMFRTTVTKADGTTETTITAILDE